MQIEMLNGLTARQFLAEYWQKKPLLIRGAFPGFRDFVSYEMLQTLAQQEAVQARLVTEHDGVWEVQQAPLQANAFRRLKRAHWSLLVQGIDHLLPAGRALLSKIVGSNPKPSTVFGMAHHFLCTPRQVGDAHTVPTPQLPNGRPSISHERASAAQHLPDKPRFYH